MRNITILIIIGIFTLNLGCAAVEKTAKWAKDCWSDSKNKNSSLGDRIPKTNDPDATHGAQ